MPFTFASDGTGRSQVLLKDEPAYIVPLQIAPSSLEDQLKQGNWLVVTMSVWSVDDIRAGRRAVELAKRQSGRFNLGLRPFDYPAEFIPWLPGVALEDVQEQSQAFVIDQANRRHVLIYGNPTASPVWVILREGKTETVAFGCLTDQEIQKLVSPLI